jgi:hypothetical protein
VSHRAMLSNADSTRAFGPSACSMRDLW